ncbi:hypothetical protein [Sphingomonas aerolata]|uniref:hypothetical protein n=1 Tax=Sphingomonas aerolata TaxID=185951 RepID=UPI002FE0A0A0
MIFGAVFNARQHRWIRWCGGRSDPQRGLNPVRHDGPDARVPGPAWTIFYGIHSRDARDAGGTVGRDCRLGGGADGSRAARCNLPLRSHGEGQLGFLDIPRLARLSHAAEDVLAAVRDNKRVPDTALVNAVLAIVDRIGEIVEAIDAGAALDDASEELLITALAEDATPAAVPVHVATVRASSRSVRLNVDLLDRMMSGMSDMVLARNELARRLRDNVSDPHVEAALERLSLTVADMRDTVTRTRMQKIDALFSALLRMVRDTSAELGKAVNLVIEGSDVELDRELIELIRDPLAHIIRNAVDHGIESPADRLAAGKPATGRPRRVRTPVGQPDPHRDQRRRTWHRRRADRQQGQGPGPAYRSADRRDG